MNKTQVKFYKDALKLYRKKGSPQQDFDNLFKLIFAELASTTPEQLSLDHTILMEEAQLHYAEKEDFKKAELLKISRESAFKVFQAREEHLALLKKIQNEKDDESKTD